MKRPDVSAIVLCYRAEDGARLVVEPLYDQLRGTGVSFEIVLVANYHPNGTDRTPDVVRQLADGRPEIRTVIEPKQGAMGWDMRTGLDAAAGEVLVVIDGDAQNPVEDVVKIYEQLTRTGVDVMKGRRIARFDGLYRRTVSYAFNLGFVLLFRTRGVRDINGKPKAFTREAYEQMQLKSDDWFIDAEIILAARRNGLQVAELPVVFRKNEERASFVKPSAIWEFVVNMARARIRGRR